MGSLKTRREVCLRAALLLEVAACSLLSAGPQAANSTPAEIDVSPSQVWTDTRIDLRAGDSIVITAAGTLTLPQNKTCGPEGQPRGFRDLMKVFPVNEGGLGALIGRVGSTDVSVPFLVGARKELELRRGGRLFLGINFKSEQLDGSFRAKVSFTTRGPEKAAVFDDRRLPPVTRAMVDRIPRRVTDEDGNPGDNTNFLIVGREKDVLNTFKAAGWIQVDRDKKAAVVHGLLDSLTKDSYVAMPMSVLTLFGRPQDYGLAHAEPLNVVRTRHHLRLWKAPFDTNRQEIWVGAATHDIGIEKDNRPGKKFTHKIDPAIDDEREYVGRSLDETGYVAKLAYIMPSKPSTEARTATGGSFHSDGRVMIIYLMSAASPAAGNPAR